VGDYDVEEVKQEKEEEEEEEEEEAEEKEEEDVEEEEEEESDDMEYSEDQTDLDKNDLEYSEDEEENRAVPESYSQEVPVNFQGSTADSIRQSHHDPQWWHEGEEIHVPIKGRNRQPGQPLDAHIQRLSTTPRQVRVPSVVGSPSSQPGMMICDSTCSTSATLPQWAEVVTPSNSFERNGEMEEEYDDFDRCSNHTDSVSGMSSSNTYTAAQSYSTSRSAPNSPYNYGWYHSHKYSSQSTPSSPYGHDSSTLSTPSTNSSSTHGSGGGGGIHSRDVFSSSSVASAPIFTDTANAWAARRKLMMNSGSLSAPLTPTRQPYGSGSQSAPLTPTQQPYGTGSQSVPNTPTRSSSRGPPRPLTTPLLPRRSLAQRRSHSTSDLYRDNNDHNNDMLALPSLTLPAPDEPEPCAKVMNTITLLKSIKQQIKAMKRRESRLSMQLQIQRRERQQMQDEIAQLEGRRLRMEAFFLRPLPLVLLLPVMASSPSSYSSRSQHQDEYDLCLISEGQDAWNALPPLIRIQLVPGARSTLSSRMGPVLLHFGPTRSQSVAASVSFVVRGVGGDMSSLSPTTVAAAAQLPFFPDASDSKSDHDYNNSHALVLPRNHNHANQLVQHQDLQVLTKFHDERFWERVTSGQVLPADANHQLEEQSCKFLYEALMDHQDLWRNQLTQVIDKKTRRIQWVLHPEASALYYDTVPSASKTTSTPPTTTLTTALALVP